MFRVPMLATLALLATSCATLDYVGETADPTSQVDLFFDEADVPRRYRVMGQMLASGDQFISAGRISERILAQAREKGADGVIILGIARVPLHKEQVYRETETESKDENEKKTVKTGGVQDITILGTEIKALFIKYRN